MATLNFITKALALKFSRKYPNIYNNYYFTNFQIVLYHGSILGPSCFDPNIILLWHRGTWYTKMVIIHIKIYIYIFIERKIKLLDATSHPLGWISYPLNQSNCVRLFRDKFHLEMPFLRISIFQRIQNRNIGPHFYRNHGYKYYTFGIYTHLWPSVYAVYKGFNCVP